MREIVDEFHFLSQVTSNITHHLTQVVLGKGIADPERNILIAGWVLAVRLEPTQKEQMSERGA
jgi:hypothetical protein